MSSRGGPDDAWYDEAAGPIVRLYAMTGGRTIDNGQEFTVSTLVRNIGAGTEGIDLSPEQSAVLRLCTGALSVAEVSASLALPLGTVKVLLEDLRAAGLIHAPAQTTDEPSLQLMQRLHNGLLAL
jgi:hypothetical protein